MPDDDRDKVVSREFTTGNATTVYDSGGRNVGRLCDVVKNKQADRRG